MTLLSHKAKPLEAERCGAVREKIGRFRSLDVSRPHDSLTVEGWTVPAKTLFIVQQFDRVGKKLVTGRQMEQPSASAAQARAERDATRCAGVVAIQQTIDTETGEVLEEPVLLAKFGELPAGMLGESE